MCNFVKNFKVTHKMDEKISGIYKITNPKGKVYIGQSIDIYKRFKSYKYSGFKMQRKLLTMQMLLCIQGYRD